MREKAKLLTTIETLVKCLEVSGSKIHENIISKIIMLKTEIEEIDIYIATLISARNVKKIKDHFSELKESGNFCAPKMWAVKRKLNVNSKGTEMPQAKKDEAGNL